MSGAYQQQTYQVPIQPISSTTETIQPIPTFYQPQSIPAQPTNQNQVQTNEAFIPQQQQQQQPFIPQQGNQPPVNQQPRNMFGLAFMNDPAMATAVQSYIDSNYGYPLFLNIIFRQYMVGRRVALGNKYFFLSRSLSLSRVDQLWLFVLIVTALFLPNRKHPILFYSMC